MAANAGFNKTSHNDLIEGVQIDEVIKQMSRQARAYQLFAYTKMGLVKDTWRIVRNDLVESTATLAESDEAAFTSFTTSAVNITPAVYPVRSHLSLELQDDAAIDIVTKARVDHGEVIMNGIDTIALATFADAASPTNHTGVSLDLTKFRAALLTFQKQNPNPGPVGFVGSYKQIDDLLGSVVTSAAPVYSNPQLGGGAAGAPIDSGNVYRGPLLGVEMFQAAVPASGGTDAIGAFMVLGQTVAVGFWKLLESRLDNANGRTGVELFSYARYGVGLTSQANIRGVISLA